MTRPEAIAKIQDLACKREYYEAMSLDGRAIFALTYWTPKQRRIVMEYIENSTTRQYEQTRNRQGELISVDELTAITQEVTK
jgi:hypothetical protein